MAADGLPKHSDGETTMTTIHIIRQNMEMPDKKALEGARKLLFGVIDGHTDQDRKAWRRWWKMIFRSQIGELFVMEYKFTRSSRFHRRSMKIEGTFFDAQEQFRDREQFRNWVKIGAGWVDWVPGPDGGIVPLPRSISYAAADDQEFREYHEKMVGFFRSGRASAYLWPHLTEQQATDMVETILEEFENDDSQNFR